MTRSLTLAAVVAAWFCLGNCETSEAGPRDFVKVGPRGGVTVGRYVGPNWRPVVKARIAPPAPRPAVVVRNLLRPSIRVSLPSPLIVNPVEYTVLGNNCSDAGCTAPYTEYYLP